jgi:hypothetical protein
MSNQRSEPVLVACPACGSQVANQAAVCPRCGQPVAAGHIPPQPHQSTAPHKVQKRPLTEWEDILRLLGMLTSRLRNWGSARMGTQSQKKLQPFTVTDKIKLGLLGLLAFLVLALIVIVPIINDNNANRISNVQTKQTVPLSTAKPIDTAAPTPKSDVKVTEAFQAEASRKGERIYKRIEAKYHLPVEFSWQAESINLAIPTKDWNSLTKEDQVNLSYYAEKLTLKIRANPKFYVDKYWHFMHFQGNSAPAYNYDSYVNAASILCSTCWKIDLGNPIYEDGKFDFEPDGTSPVTGATADAFRQSVEKEVSKSSDEKDKEESDKFAVSISFSEHLGKAKEVLSMNPNVESESYKLGYYLVARKHLKVIPKNAPEFAEAQELLKKVARPKARRRNMLQELCARGNGVDRCPKTNRQQVLQGLHKS